VLLALVGGTAATAWGLVRAEHQRQLAEAKEREAVAEREDTDLDPLRPREDFQKLLAELEPKGK
jgi:hypothetical protein